MPKGNYMDNPFPKRTEIPQQKGVGESTSKSTKDYREHKGTPTGSPKGPGVKIPSAGAVSE